MATINIDQLHPTAQSFSRCQLEFLSENCIVALSESGHQTRCKLTLPHNERTYTVEWTKVVPIAGYQDPAKYTEHGAEAIAFVLATKIPRYQILEEAVTGTGFDYWLGYPPGHKNYDPKNFMRARMEVSGILKEEGSNTMAKRIAQKKKQVQVTDDLKLPAYIAIIEFSTPQAFFAKK